MLWLSHIEIWGTRFTSIFSIVSVMPGWIAEMLIMLLSAYIGQKIAEYEAYWLMGFPIINLWGARFTRVRCILHIFCYGWMDCRDTFHAVLCLYCCVTNTTKLSMKHTGLSVFQKLILEMHISYSFLQSGIRKLNN